MKMTGFICHDHYLNKLAKLSDQEVGRLVRALSKYHATGETQELKGRECGYYDFIKGDIDEIELAYQRKCENMKRPQPTAIDRNCDQLPAKDPKNININKNTKETPLKGSKEKPERATGESDRAFDKFWAIYPRHEGKQDARKAFDKLKPDQALLETIVNAITAQKQSAQWQDSRYIPHPATWLNGRRWEDEPVKDTGTVGKPRLLRSQDYHQREYDGKKLEDELGVNDLFKEGEAV